MLIQAFARVFLTKVCDLRFAHRPMSSFESFVQSARTEFPVLSLSC
jgi:hypothetical protein